MLDSNVFEDCNAGEYSDFDRLAMVSDLLETKRLKSVLVKRAKIEEIKNARKNKKDEWDFD